MNNINKHFDSLLRKLKICRGLLDKVPDGHTCETIAFGQEISRMELFIQLITQVLGSEYTPELVSENGPPDYLFPHRMYRFAPEKVRAIVDNRLIICEKAISRWETEIPHNLPFYSYSQFERVVLGT